MPRGKRTDAIPEENQNVSPDAVMQKGIPDPTEHINNELDFKQHMIDLGIKLCDDAKNGNTSDIIKTTDAATRVFSAVFCATTSY